MPRKTSTSKSPTTSSKTSVGKKETNLRGQSKEIKSSLPKSKIRQNQKNQQCLTTTGTQSKKKKSTTTSTQSPKAKNTKTSTNNTKRSSTNTRQKRKDPSIKIQNTRKIELFPHHQTFPIFLDDKSEGKRCWFTCPEHAQKYIDRYQPKYKCYQYTGK